jgi:chromate transporter
VSASTAAAAATEAISAPAPSPRDLFTGFAAVGLSGFGGALPWARRLVVERRRWLSGAEFTEVLALAQLVPGPNVGNIAVAIGSRYHGWRGAAAATAGLYAGPFVIVLILGAIYARYASLPVVRHAFAGLAAAAAALMLANAIKIAAPLRTNLPGCALALATLVMIAALRWPLLPVLLVMAPVSIAVAHWRNRRRMPAA